MRSSRKRFARVVCLCLCVALMGTAVAETTFNESIQVTALPTPTPEPSPEPSATHNTQAPAADAPPSNGSVTNAPATDAPATDAPATDAPATDTPASEAPTQVPDSASPLPEASTAPEASTTPGDTATPEASITPEGTTTPETPATPEASIAPEASATPEDTATPEPTPGGPVCETEGCKHIGVNNAGEVVALCAVGQQLLDEADMPNPMLRSASVPTHITLLNEENIIYRSGTYVLSGGGDSATLYIRQGLALSLTFENVSLLTLKLNDGANVRLNFSGRSVIKTLAAQGARLVLDGSGSLVVANNFNCDALTVESGSAQLPAGAVSQNGYLPCSFNAPGALTASLDGVFLSNINTDDNGNVCLWLPPLSGGATYTAAQNGNELQINSLPPAPAATDEYDVSSGTAFAPESDKAYAIKASNPNNQAAALTINAAGVSLKLSGIGSESSKPSIQANQPLSIFISGENRIAALSGEPVALSGAGILRVDSFSASGLTASGAMAILIGGGSAPSGWQAVSVGANVTADMSVSLNGQRLPFAVLASEPQTLYLPISAAMPGYRWEALLGGTAITVSEVPGGAATEVLTDAGLILNSGAYRITAPSATSGEITIPDGANVTLTLLNVSTTGAIKLGANASVTLTLEASNDTGALVLANGASLAVNGTGALLAASASGGSIQVHGQTNLSLVNGSELPGGLKPTVLTVTDETNAPMRSKDIVLKLGNSDPFSTTTASNGQVTLWAQNALSGVDAVVLSDANTYAAIITGGTASPDALPQISNVQVNSHSVITFTATNANTLGIQYIIAKSEVDMPDTWVSGAKTVLMQNGECNIPELQNGDIVTLRAIASRQANAVLTEATSDGFAFGDKITFAAGGLRIPLTIPAQEKTYDGKALALSTRLYPKDASVSYFKGNELLKGAPVDVGEYTARVTVPGGNSTYLPGSYDVRLTIKRIVIHIYPEEASKEKGQPDPDFYYTYDDDKMLGNDQVTGVLIRKKGEAYGNYPYYTDRLRAPDYYQLVIDPNTPAFFIDWNIHHYLPYDPLSRIDPVYDELLLSNGSTLRVQLRTGELLRIGEKYYGSLVTDMVDGRERPMTPSLRLRGGYDSALLIISAEAELNADGGYATDLDGSRIFRGRRLTLRQATLSGLVQQNIDDIAFSLDGVTLQFSLNDLRNNKALDSWLEDNGISKGGIRYEVELEPVLGTSALTGEEASAALAAGLGEKLMRVSVWAVNGDSRLEISSVLPSARLLFDASPLLDDALAAEADAGSETQTINGRPVADGVSAERMQREAAVAGAKGETETSEELLEVTYQMLTGHIQSSGASLVLYQDTAKPLDITVVVPYTASEAATAAFRAMLRTRPYLTTVFARNGLYGLRAQAE